VTRVFPASSTICSPFFGVVFARTSLLRLHHSYQFWAFLPPAGVGFSRAGIAGLLVKAPPSSLRDRARGEVLRNPASLAALHALLLRATRPFDFLVPS